MSIHTVISIDDSLYLHWQTQLLFFSMEQVKQPGSFTRLVATQESSRIRQLEGKVNTFLTQSYCPHPFLKDHYPPYNKAASLREWAVATPDKGETILLIDPDCVFLRPVYAEVQPGSPIAEQMFFMSTNCDPGKKIIQRHCKRNSHLAQPIGIPIFIRKSDLRLICPRWIQLCAEMREDKKTKEEIPWICEMWAYVLAAAEAGIKHILVNNQQFPTENITGRSIIHYSYATVSKDGNWKWDKRDYKPWTRPKPYPSDIPSAGKLLHKLLEQAASHYGYAIIS